MCENRTQTGHDNAVMAEQKVFDMRNKLIHFSGALVLQSYDIFLEYVTHFRIIYWQA